MNKEIVLNEFYNMDGFDCTYEGNLITVNDGVFTPHDSAGDLLHTFNFEGIQFEVIADETFPTVYDLYFVENVDGLYEYHLDRTVMRGDVIASFKGSEKLIHNYINILLEPDQTLDTAAIFNVFHLERKEGHNEDATAQLEQ